jgi:hypothetical protein
LHFSHIGLTLGRTFIGLLCSLPALVFCLSSVLPAAYLYR